jgi:hypothetical protein
MTGESKFLPINLPAGSTRADRQGFNGLCEVLSKAILDQGIADHGYWFDAAGLGSLYDRPVLAAAAHTLIDLVDQGWAVRMVKDGPLLSPPSPDGDRSTEKSRIRRQEHLRRDEQLRKPSVRRFVQGMEQTHQWGTRLVSIFDLMRDGRELADALQRDPSSKTVIRPYVQIVDGSTCELTGFKLHDIWRYFRHTWTNAYSTVPGRSMPILVRDAATELHTVIGLAAISSPVVQIAERDRWIGWETDQFLEEVRSRPTAEMALWFRKRLEMHRSEIYVDDLLRDNVLQPTDLTHPSPEGIALLRADAERHRNKHHRASTVRGVRAIERDSWKERAETHLFRSKRSTALAEALEISSLLGSYLSPDATAEELKEALADPRARTQMRRVVRRARGERVGTVIADLTVCGAVAPYNALVAGKLVGALAVSPKVLTAYRNKYTRASEIASAMAGRPIVREARLSFVGTTSLYGTGSSQYNRLYWPAEVMGGPEGVRMGFHELGKSRSFGTSHFSQETVEALVRLSVHNGSLVRVNGLFGEGVSPRLRKVRIGLAALGWPSDELLKHGRERIVYGVPLVDNLRNYSLGIDSKPDYFLDPTLEEADSQVADWWLERWCQRRAAQPAVLESMRSHRLVRPVDHGARVLLPADDELLPSTDSGTQAS